MISPRTISATVLGTVVGTKSFVNTWEVIHERTCTDTQTLRLQNTFGILLGVYACA